jgi:hypothetical protein
LTLSKARATLALKGQERTKNRIQEPGVRSQNEKGKPEIRSRKKREENLLMWFQPYILAPGFWLLTPAF